jgi:hypothetical protein
MMASVRELLRRKLSSQIYQRISFYKWIASFYLPRSAGSFFVRRTANIRGFAGGAAQSELHHQMSSVNAAAPTKMCRVMTKHGSDKGRGWHNYTTIYSVIFGKLRDQPLRIFELGLGTNNPELESTMGANGRPGASLRGWRELFPHALIYGADVDRDILFEENRINTFYCNQLDKVAIQDLWSQPILQGGMDILIEDGLHTFEGNKSFLDGSLEQVRPGGFYVIEDIHQKEIARWSSELETIYTKRFPDYQFWLVELPNSLNESGNNLLIIQRLK